MTTAHPVAVDIDLSQPASNAAMAQLGSPDGGWLESSRDLLYGLRTREMPLDTLPDDLVEAFTKTSR